MHSWMPHIEFRKQDKSLADFHKHSTKFCRSQRVSQRHLSFCTLTIANFQMTKALIKNNREISHVYKYSDIAILMFTAVLRGTN